MMLKDNSKMTLGSCGCIMQAPAPLLMIAAKESRCGVIAWSLVQLTRLQSRLVREDPMQD
jgi:hypothetical protein